MKTSVGGSKGKGETDQIVGTESSQSAGEDGVIISPAQQQPSHVQTMFS